jgi:hypothetical protein
MRLTLLFILTLTISVCRSQTILFEPDPVKKSFLIHSKSNWLVGAGATYFGLTAKGGRFFADRWWVGAEMELHELLSSRQEVGLFTRYYTGERKINGFIGGGLSYGHFQTWNWDIDNFEPDPPLYRSVKLNALVGLEIRVAKRFSLEGVLKGGRLTKVNWIQPSLQGSINYYIGR